MSVTSNLPTGGKSGGGSSTDSQNIAEIKQNTEALLVDSETLKTAAGQTQAMYEGTGMENAPLYATGIAPDNMKEMIVVPKNSAVRIRFTEPEDTFIDGQLVCSVKGVKVVAKVGSYPAHENDGFVVLQNEEKGKYAQEAFEYGELTNGVQYYFGFFPYSDHGVFNRNSANRKTATPKEQLLFAFKIDKNNTDPYTSVTYLEDAVGMTPAHMDYAKGVFDYGSWKDVWFVEENKPYMVKYDGTPDYQLDPNNHALKLNGEDSDVANPDYAGNAMAKFPLVWLKQWDDGNFEYCNISNVQIDDTYHAYAHQRADGSIMEYKWLRMYGGSEVSGKLRSLSGRALMQSKTRQQEVTLATANGENWYTTAQCDRNLLDMLLLLISKDQDAQNAFGNGNLNYNSSNTATYGMLSTGTMNKAGQFYGYNDLTHQVKVFYIEKWWAEQWEATAGYINDKGVIKIKMTKPYNFTGAGYDNTGTTMSGTSGGYVSTTKMTEWGRLPIVVSGAEKTGPCAGAWFNNSQVDYAFSAGDCSYGLRCAPGVCVGVSALASYVGWYFSAGLSCDQPKAA